MLITLKNISNAFIITFSIEINDVYAYIYIYMHVCVRVRLNRCLY